MRDDFSEGVKRKLADRVNRHCSNPDCRAPTSGPQDDPFGTVNVGVAAHITAASPNGPRRDSALTPEQRSHIDNGIWLCGTCGILIDSDRGHYTVELLRAWKLVAEDQARSAIGKTVIATAPPTLELYLEGEGISGGYFSATNPARCFVLGLNNLRGGTAKFPGVRYRVSCGLMLDQLGIDGDCGFGLPKSPSEREWLSFRGGADNVIHPGQIIKIARLRQRGENVGLEGINIRRGDLAGPDGRLRLVRWVFREVKFEFEISAEGIAIKIGTILIPSDSMEWST